MEVKGMAVENQKQITEQVERLTMLSDRISSSTVNVGAKIEPILSSASEGEDSKAGSPPLNGHAPLSTTLKGIADELEHSLYRLESMFDRVEL